MILITIIIIIIIALFLPIFIAILTTVISYHNFMFTITLHISNYIL